MEPFPVWNRIEQLERLVVSQANEIETLKRSIQRIDAQTSLRELQQNDDPPNIATDNRRYSRPQYSSSSHLRTSRRDNTYNRDTILSPQSYYKSRQQQQQQQQCHDISPYHMNSFVHPSSAIPPRGSARWQQPYQPTLRLTAGRPTLRLQSPPRTPPLSPPIQSPPLPISNKRWSAAPNIRLPQGEVIDDVIGGESQDLDDDSLSHEKQRRQKFVESPKPESQSQPQPQPDTQLTPVENQDIIQILSDDADSDIELVARIAPRKPNKSVPRYRHVKKSSSHQRSLTKIEPGTNNSNNSDKNLALTPYNKTSPNVTTKQLVKSVPKRNRPRVEAPEEPDQSWIWSREASQQRRPSLPTELKEIIKNSPF